jgi:hypothetical protein
MNGGKFGPAEKRRTAKVGVHACNTAKLMSLSTRELIFRIVGSGGRGAQVAVVGALGEAASLLPLFSR